MYDILHVNNRAVRGLYSLRDRQVSKKLIAIYVIAVTPSRTKIADKFATVHAVAANPETWGRSGSTCVANEKLSS